MTIFFDLLNFFELHQSSNGLQAHEIAAIIGINPTHTDFCEKKTQNICSLKESIEEDPNNGITFIKDKLRFSKKDLEVYILILEITNPGLIKKKDLIFSPRDSSLNETKSSMAIFAASNSSLFDHEIAAKLCVPIEKVKAERHNLPVPRSVTSEFEILKRENYIREFFAIYPYSTIIEAAKVLRLSEKEIRVVIEELIRCGEVVRFNNVPKPIEYEEKKLEIVELKLKNPGLTDKEISLELGLSVNQVRQSLQDTVRIWQIEKAIKYDFYFNKTIDELEIIKAEAIEKAKNSTSSRWMELRLVAIEKTINMLGLKSPEKIEINKNITITKKQRDSVLEAYLATDAIEAEFSHVEVTGGR